ncbi:MAG: tetratricopeptide repeat protein [Deltaproteobacteria bacterium]|nr:tetratricopeptide repeat protein [Deltaproteobacteria bacterium]
MAIDPVKLHVYNLVGIALRKVGRYEEAVRQYKKALELMPGDENIYYNIARAYYEMGDVKQAETNVRAALNINPKFEEATLFLKAIGKSGTTAAAPTNVYRKNDQLDGVILKYEKVVESNDNIATRILLGKFCTDKQDFQRSMSHFMAALKLDPGCLEAFLGMGRMFKEMGDYRRALKALEEGLRRADQAIDQPELSGYVSFYVDQIQKEVVQISAVEEYSKGFRPNPREQKYTNKPRRAQDSAVAGFEQ